MELISNGHRLSRLLCKLIEESEQISFAVAWATPNDVYDCMLQHKNKILKATIGTHFFQTSPKILNDFLGDKKIHFVLETNGVFHPKIYFFRKQKQWHLIIGSANLTHAAFNSNQEAVVYSVLDENNDVDCRTIQSIKDFLRDMYKTGRIVTQKEFRIYSEMCGIHKNKIKSLSSRYEESQSKTNVNSLSCDLQTMTWTEYLKKIHLEDKYDSIEQRCMLLSLAQKEFSSKQHFSDISLSLRKAIAGTVTTIPEAGDISVGFFGSMLGAGEFKKQINNNNPNISEALDCIPLTGDVNEKAYYDYIEYFCNAFPNGKDGLAVATRLLALKRPDQFLCIDGQNRKALAKEFGITQSSLTGAKRYTNYWNSVVLRIRDSIWWNTASPTNNKNYQKDIWNGRVAMLDAIFYVEKE